MRDTPLNILERALRRPGLGHGAAVCAIVLALALPAQQGAAADGAAMPFRLEETGLYADPASSRIAPGLLEFEPQYPLWTDGATKRRWISIPAGSTIDASDPDAWIFPVGTRFWKEFSFDGHRAETRLLERRADGAWHYAAYEWNAEGTRATLAPAEGRAGAYPLGDRRAHTIPGIRDCKVCHQSNPTEILGFSALQLSPDRDPGALHAGPVPEPRLDLPYLVGAGLLKGLPEDLLRAPPRIAAESPAERAAFGYMHGNCGHCHNDSGSLSNLGLVLRHGATSTPEPGRASTVGQPVRKLAPGQTAETVLRVAPGDAARSGLYQRIASRWAALQMPPLGTVVVDEEALALIGQWIEELAPE